MAATGESYSIARMFIFRGSGPNRMPRPPHLPPPRASRPKRWDAGQVECPHCQAIALLLGDGEPRCTACGYTDTAEAVADEYLEQVVGLSRYASEKDGDGWPAFSCPDCDLGDALIRMPGKEEGYMCFDCGGVWRIGVLQVCDECQQPRRLDEMVICDPCYNAKVSNSD